MKHRLLAGVILFGVSACEFGFKEEADSDTKDNGRKTDLCEQVMPGFEAVSAAWDTDEQLVPAVQVEVTEDVASAFISYNVCDRVAEEGFDHFDDLPGQGCLYKVNRRVLTKRFYVYQLAAGQRKLAVAPCRYDGTCAAPKEVVVQVPEYGLTDVQQRHAGEKDALAKLVAETADKVLDEQLSGPDAVNRAAGVLGQSGVADILSLAIDVAEFEKTVAQGQVASAATPGGGCRFGAPQVAGLNLADAASAGARDDSTQSPLGDIDFNKELKEWTPRVTLVLAVLGTGKAIYDLHEEGNKLKAATEKVRLENAAAVKASEIIKLLRDNPKIKANELSMKAFEIPNVEDGFDRKMQKLLGELSEKNQARARPLAKIIDPNRPRVDATVLEELKESDPLVTLEPKAQTLSRSGKLKVGVGVVIVAGTAAVVFKDQIQEQIDKLGLNGAGSEHQLFMLMRHRPER